MDAKFSDISAALVTALQTIDELYEVKAYATSQFSGYPAGCVYLSGNENSFLDSNSNEVSYIFTIRIVDELKDDPAATESRMLTLADELVETLDRSDGLGGIVFYLQPAAVSAGFDTNEAGAVRVFQFEIVARCTITLI